MTIDPDAYYAQLVYADALYTHGLMFDSKVHFDLAVSHAPSDKKTELESISRHHFSYYLMDHKTVATIGPGGKVTFKQIQTPLPQHLGPRSAQTNTPKPLP